MHVASPYRASRLELGPFAPSLRFAKWVSGAFLLPAFVVSLMTSMELFVGPSCKGSFAGEGAMLLLTAGISIALGIYATKLAVRSARRRARPRTWVGKMAWTVIASLPSLVGAVFAFSASAWFEMKYLFLACLDFGGIAAFH